MWICSPAIWTGSARSIPYFKELGLTYLHLMPLVQLPEGENDGGYAICSYREVDPPLGTMAHLTDLAANCARTASAWWWILSSTTPPMNMSGPNAPAGDPEYREYYLIFPDRRMPDAYERTLREIFPDEHPGAFTYFEEASGWVWTTFHSYQWDLNYATRQFSPAWPRKCCPWPMPGWKCCAWMRWPSSGSSWARAARTCPKRTI